MMQFQRSGQLYSEAGQVLAGGVSSGVRRQVAPVLYFDRTDGPYFIDVDGNRFIDYTLAWGPLIAGGNHPHINAAVHGVVERFYSIGAQHELEVALARRITEVCPGVELVNFTSSGTEAVQFALRLARAATGRAKFVKFSGHYHGWIGNVLAGYHPTREEIARGPEYYGPRPSVAGQTAAELADTILVTWNDAPALDRAFAAHPDQIACVLMEPLLVNAGGCVAQEGYLRQVLATCKAHGALVIFDEVITGFRLALGGAREYFGLKPDISTYAKALGGGFTIGAVGATQRVYDELISSRTIHSGTTNGSPINTAASLATVELLSEPGVYPRMHRLGQELADHITTEGRRLGHTLVTSGTGTCFSVHFGQKSPPLRYEDTLDTDMVTYARLREQLLHQGIYTLHDGRWYVGLTHTQEQLEQTKAAVTTAFAAISS